MAQSSTTVKVSAEIPKNRLYITVFGRVSKNDVEKLYSEVRFCVADLKSNFHVITDLRECKIGLLVGIPTLRKVISYLISQGVGETVRIVQKNSLIFQQFINFGFKIQGYKPAYVYSFEEAETYLEKALERDGLRLQLHNHAIIYFYQGQENKGQIVDISKSGCSIKTEWREALKDQEVLLKFTLAQQAPVLFEIPARVVREDGNIFAVKFLNLESAKQEKLWNCLLYEAKRDTFVENEALKLVS